MFRFVKFQRGSCDVAKSTGRLYSQVSVIESWVFGRMVNKSDEFMNGRDIIFNGCPMLLPKRVLFRTQHTAHAKQCPNRITLPSGPPPALRWNL